MDAKPREAPSALATAAWLTLGAAFLGWMLDGVEQGIIPLIARPALQQMGMHGDMDVGLWMGRLTALFLLGAAAGGAVFGWLGDRIGRVRAMSYSILVYSVFTGLSYFAVHPWHLAVLRVVASLGMGGQWSLGVALVMETWPEKHRPMLAGVIGASANVGFFLLAGIAYVVPITPQSWRWIMLVGAAPAILTFLIRLYVPESEKWRTAVSTAAEPPQPLREIFARGLRGRTFIAITVSAIALIGTWGSVQWIPLWADKLAGVPSAKAAAAACAAAGAIIGCFVGSLLGSLGRRRAYCVLCLFSYGSCWLLFRTVGKFGAEFLVLTFLIGGFTAAFYGWLPLYLPELFPTRVRATAAGVSYNSGRIIAAAGAIGAGQLVSYYQGSYAHMGATITLVYLIGAVVVWIAPETRGKPLPA